MSTTIWQGCQSMLVGFFATVGQRNNRNVKTTSYGLGSGMHVHRILAGFVQDASKSNMSRSCGTGNLQKAQLCNRHQESQTMTGPAKKTKSSLPELFQGFKCPYIFALQCFLFLAFPNEIGIRSYWVEVLQPLLFCEDSYEKDIHVEERVGKAGQSWVLRQTL